MTAYVTTWVSGGYNANDVNALNAIETQAAKMLQGGRNSATPVNSPWGERSGSRTMGTNVTNGSFLRLVVPSIKLAGPNLSAAGVAIASAVLDPSVANINVGRASLPGATTARSAIVTMPFIVQPGEVYKVSDVSTGGAGCTATIDKWYEFDFGGIYTAQTWLNLERNAALTKPNTYANGVNDIVRADAMGTIIGTPVTIGNQRDLPGSVMTFVGMTAKLGGVVNSGEANFQVKDSGGALTTVGHVFTDFVGQYSFPFAAMLNASGSYKVVNVSNASIDTTGTNEGPLALQTAIVFAAAANGVTAVGNKFRSLDTNASKGVNAGINATRTDNGTSGASRTPSTTAWSIAVAWVQLSPSATVAASANISPAGSSFTEALAPAAGPVMDLMLIAIIPPNTAYTVVVNAQATIKKVVDWVVNS